MSNSTTVQTLKPRRTSSIHNRLPVEHIVGQISLYAGAIGQSALLDSVIEASPALLNHLAAANAHFLSLLPKTEEERIAIAYAAGAKIGGVIHRAVCKAMGVDAEMPVPEPNGTHVAGLIETVPWSPMHT